MSARLQTLLSLLGIVSVFSGTIAENSYMFVSSKTIRPGHNLTVQGSLLTTPSAPVDVTVAIVKGKPRFPDFRPMPLLAEDVPAGTTTTTPAPEPVPFVEAYATFADTQTQNIVLQVPSSLIEGDYDLKVTGTGGLVFENSSRLNYEAKSHSILVQTDKAIYKPGQTVHFRVFGVTPDLKIVFENLEVDLFDPSGNKINQWDVTEKQLREAAGVFESQMLMSDSPVLGDWKLTVNMGKEKYDKTFTVDEYVLPKFEVTLDLPPFGRANDNVFEGNVEAKYTYGKPVKGEATVRISAKWPRTRWVNGTSVKISKEIELQMPIDGTASFSVPVKQLREVDQYLDYSTLVFEANVTESLTGSKMSASEELQFYENPIKLEFPSALPGNFKPGMTYTAVLKVSERDDSPPSVIKGDVVVSITFYKPMVTTTTTTTTTTPLPPTTPPEPAMIDGKLVFPVIEPPIVPIMVDVMPPRRWWWPREEEIKQPPKMFSIPADGIVEIPVSVPSDITRVEINAEYEKTTAYHSIRKANSPSESYLQLRLLTENPKTGQNLAIEVRSTESTGEAIYQVMSKGNIVASGKFNLADGAISFPVTSEMAPKAKIMVYYIRSDGEVVADGLSLNVDGIFDNKVTVEFNKLEAEPGDNVTFSVTSDPGSKVNVLAIDKSVLLLKSGNDITKDQVKSELQSYDPTDNDFGCGWLCWRWPMPTGGSDAESVFKNAGIVYITDALVYTHNERRRDFKMLRKGVPMMAMAAGTRSIAKTTTTTTSTPQNMATPKRVRALFPETWLWKSTSASDSGVAEFNETVPDTITSWVATAFAVHPDSGLGISETAANLKTFLPFFVSLHLPYSVVRGEKVIIQANVFNYSPNPMFAYVILERNTDYENIYINPWWTSTYSANVARFVRLQPNSATAVYFPIIPRKLGKIKLKVQARTLFSADALEKDLLVEPEGTPKEYNVPVLINMEQPEFTAKVPISFPVGTVLGSERIRVTAIGDLMGPSVNGLDELLKMPYGCGEQNMLNFAPNIFIIKYLEATNNLDVATQEKAKGYMVKGYQRELTYQHHDGSFSAFGNSDPSGSLWLSAFVVKCFAQAKPYIFIDNNVVKRAVDWIIEHQATNGSFTEPGKVLHKAMQGGSIGSERALTSFVLIALLEARDAQGLNVSIGEAVSKATTFIEAGIAEMSDAYELAIAGYALTLAGSPRATEVMAKLQTIAKIEGGMKYWEVPEEAIQVDVHPWENRKNKGKAMNVEMTAYALLALAQAGNKIDGLQVLKWLISQRNPNGGYSSTQDTVVALQSLADMASLVYSKNFNMNITVTGPPESVVQEQFTVTPDNALILQSRELPSDIREVNIAAKGTGLSLVEVAVFYNVDSDDQAPSFGLKVTVLEETINDFKVETCTRWLKEGASAMSVIEIGSPSGFSADKNSVTPHPLLKRVEDGDKKVVLYLDEIGKDELCFTVSMERIGLVAAAQPVPVKVYDYYEPTNSVMQFYVPDAVRNADVCDVCGQECSFCSKEQKPWWRS